MEPEITGDGVTIEQEQVTVEQQDDQATGSVTTEGQEEVQQEVEETQPENRDDYWKNRSYEFERKLSKLTDDIPKMVEETIIKTSKQTTQEKEYTVAELEAYAMENPEHRPWVEEQKQKILERKFEEKLNQKEKAQQIAFKRQQSEQKVLNDPRYAEAFTDQGGIKVFNPNSPLAHKIHAYMNDSRLNGQPDALEIAAKLAYADHVTNDTVVKEQKLTTLKRQNTKLKQATMVEGGGVTNPIPTQDAFQAASEKLRKSGSRKDAQEAIKAYYAKYGN